MDVLWTWPNNFYVLSGKQCRGLATLGSFNQSGWSIALRRKGEWTNDEVTSEFSESYFTLVKHKRHRKAVSVQKSEDYKTQILKLLGEITFVIRPDSFFVNLWGACDSSVLQCTNTDSTVYFNASGCLNFENFQLLKHLLLDDLGNLLIGVLKLLYFILLHRRKNYSV
jgi:hypothetical protein